MKGHIVWENKGHGRRGAKVCAEVLWSEAELWFTV